MDHRLIFPEDFSKEKEHNFEKDHSQWQPHLKSSLDIRASKVWSLPPRLKTITINEVNSFQNQPLSSPSSMLPDINDRLTPFWSKNKCHHHFSSQSCVTKILFPLGPITSSRTFCLRLFQITTIILSFMVLCILVSSTKETLPSEKEFVPSADPLNFKSWITSPLGNTEIENLPENSNKLLDLQDFHFILNNASKCSLNNENDKIFFIILVHSAPKHFEERQAIRSTWGSVQNFDNFFVRLVFLLGTSVGFPIQEESEEFGDIVSGNFVDSYRNLTYKHLMGYKWALRYCSNAKFVLKTDDDAFVAIFQLINFIRRTFGDNPRKSLICNVLPEGTHPVRNSDNDKETKSKWLVTKTEYPYNIYPKYCSGLAYLATPDVLRDLLRISSNVKYMWIDDVFVTGIIRDLAVVQPFYLNLRYSYDVQEYRKWLTTGRGGHNIDNWGRSKNISRSISNSNSISDGQYSTSRLPFMFAHLERGRFLGVEMRSLWHKISQL